MPNVFFLEEFRDSDLTDFIYAGPGSSIPTNFPAEKFAKEFPNTGSENRTNKRFSDTHLSTDSKTEAFLRESVLDSEIKSYNSGNSFSPCREEIRPISACSTGEERPTFQEKVKGHQTVSAVKASPDLEETAIRTVQLVCGWYLLCMCIGGTLYFCYVLWIEATLPFKAKLQFEKIMEIFNVTNSSFNLFFYLRGNAFRNKFHARWPRFKHVF